MRLPRYMAVTNAETPGGDMDHRAAGEIEAGDASPAGAEQAAPCG